MDNDVETKNHYLKCCGEVMLNYYIKPDGDCIREYWRCNKCLTLIEVSILK